MRLRMREKFKQTFVYLSGLIFDLLIGGNSNSALFDSESAVLRRQNPCSQNNHGLQMLNNEVAIYALLKYSRVLLCKSEMLITDKPEVL